MHACICVSKYACIHADVRGLSAKFFFVRFFQLQIEMCGMENGLLRSFNMKLILLRCRRLQLQASGIHHAHLRILKHDMYFDKAAEAAGKCGERELQKRQTCNSVSSVMIMGGRGFQSNYQ